MTPKPSNHPIDAFTEDRVGEGVEERVGAPVEERIGEPVDNFSDSVIHLETRSPTRSTTHSPVGSLTGQSGISYIDESVNSSARILTDNQAIVYYCLKWLQGRATSILTISNVTGVNVHTVKSALQKMRKSGHIKEYGGLANIGGRVGFSAIVNDCKIILRGNAQRVANLLKNLQWEELLLARSINDCVLDDPLLNHRLGPLLNHPHDHSLDNLMPPTALSSSSFFEKSTTTEWRTELERCLDHPEMGYWKARRITVGKLQSWLIEFRKAHPDEDITPLKLFISMCYCAWDMVELGNEKNLKKNPEDLFYKAMMKHGLYFKPKGYVSYEEKRIEYLKQLDDECQRRKENQIELDARKLLEEKDVRAEEFNQVLEEMRKNNKYISENMEGPMFRGSFIETYKKLKKEILDQHSVH